MGAWDTAAAVAARQHLLITTWQLRLLGISAHAVGDRVKRHGWHRPVRGVVALPGEVTDIRRLALAVLALSSPEGAELRVQEAIAGGGTLDDAVVYAAVCAGQLVAGRSALWLHGVGPCPEKSWVRLPARANATFDAEAVVVRYGPATGTPKWIEGLHVVDVEQALMDIAGPTEKLTPVQRHHDLTKLIATAVARRLTTLDRVEQRIGAAPRFVGAPALRKAVADLRGELTHSATEKKARAMVRKTVERHGYTLHPEPFTVVSQGIPVGEADIPVLALRLDIEIDGPHHRFPEQQERDRLRDRMLRRAGWEVERFPTDLVDLHPQRFVAEADECVRARISQIAPP